MFSENANRVRKGHGPAEIAALRNLMLRLRLPKRLCRALSEAQICTGGKRDVTVRQILDADYQGVCRWDSAPARQRPVGGRAVRPWRSASRRMALIGPCGIDGHHADDRCPFSERFGARAQATGQRHSPPYRQ